MRLAAKLALIAAMLSFLASAALTAANHFFAETGGAYFGKAAAAYFPDLDLSYESAVLRISRQGAHLRAYGLAVRRGGVSLKSGAADFWLNDDGLNIALSSPSVHIAGDAGLSLFALPRAAAATVSAPAPRAQTLYFERAGDNLGVTLAAYGGDAAAGGGLDIDWNPDKAFLFSGGGLRLTFDDVPLTLHSARFAVQRKGGVWKLRVTDSGGGRRLSVYAEADGNLRGTLAAAYDGALPPGLPLAGEARDVRLRLDIGEAVTITAAGALAASAPLALSAAFYGRGVYADGGGWTAGGARALLSDGRATAAVTLAQAGGVGGEVTLIAGEARMSPLPLTALLSYLPDGGGAAMAEAMQNGALRLVTIGAAGGGVWRRDGDGGGGWDFSGGRLSVFNDEAAADMTLSLAADGGGSLQIEAGGILGEVPLTAAAKYLPDGEARDWLLTAVAGGRAADGAFYVRRGGGGDAADILRVTAAFSGGRLLIDEGWPAADALAGVFAVNDNDIRIDGEGVFGDITAADVVARLPAIDGDFVTLFLDIRGAPAAFAGHWRAARQTPAITAFIADAEKQMTITDGRAALSLSLAVPLAAPENTAARARLSLRYVRGRAGGAPALTGVGGHVDITNDGIGGALTGRLAAAAPDAPPLTIAFAGARVSVGGRADAALLMSLAGAPPLPAAGTLEFSLRDAPGKTRIFTASLRDTAINLPAPAGKAAGAPAALSLRLGDDNLAVYTRGDLSVRLYVDAQNAGEIAVNDDSRQLLADGFFIHGAAADADGDGWLNLFRDAAGGGGAPPLALALTLRGATLLAQGYDSIAISAAAGGEVYAAEFDAPHMRGRITLAGNTVRGNFAHLRLADGGGDLAGFDIKNLSVALSAATLVLPDGITLGAAEVAGGPQGGIWRLATLRLRRGATTLTLSGVYDGERTQTTLALNIGDVPAFMADFALPAVIGEGRFAAAGNLAWRGSPLDFAPAALTGGFVVDGADVRYLDTDADGGIINLLAVFSPQSLVNLGFVEIAKTGIIFDSVRGTLRIAGGIASGKDILLQSEDLLINIGGTTDFARKTHNLRGRVRPGKKILNAGATIGLGAGLVAVQPLALLAFPLFGKIFEEPLSEIGAYEYTITGNWDDPVYTEIGVTKPAADGGGDN